MGVATVGRSAPRYGIGLALLVGASVAVALGVYANLHDPTGLSLVSLFFTRTINLKVWFATAAMALALFQVMSGAKMEGKLGSGHGPRWLPRAHRASGTVAFLLTVVVAYHCLWALGFQADYTRVLIHGIAGCIFFGALATKILVVRGRGMPNYAYALAGGLLFSALIVVWLTSALWFFLTVEFPGF
jgi:hypothetical protein